MLTTKEAIEKRRSIRKFRPDIIPKEILEELIESARLAPSNGNSQPWCFKSVTDPIVKTKLAEAAYNQNFIVEAPVILVCCASLKDYAKNIATGAQGLANINEIGQEFVDKIIVPHTKALSSLPWIELGKMASVSVAIAIEHILLRALDYNIGGCWVSANSKKVCEVFNWDEDMFVVALLPLGYFEVLPKARQRKALNEMTI